MTQPILGEVRLFPYNFAPRNWALCRGQILPISQNTALFSLLGTTYGGNGQTTFALPNLQGRMAKSRGQGAGLQDYALGEEDGVESVTLISTEMPAHNHTLPVQYNAGAAADWMSTTPASNLQLSRLLIIPKTGAAYANAQMYNTPPLANPVQLNPQVVGIAGGSQPHNNLQPYLTLNWCIAIQGVFPARN